MIVTELEAMELMCPLATAANHNIRTTCIASGCMAWRWSKGSEHRDFIHCGNSILETEPVRNASYPESYIWKGWDDAVGEPAGWHEPEDEFVARRTGYCGMAGGLK